VSKKIIPEQPADPFHSMAEDAIAPYLRRIAKDLGYLFTWNDQSMRYHKGNAPFGERVRSRQMDFVLAGHNHLIKCRSGWAKWHTYAHDVERDSKLLNDEICIIRVSAKDCIDDPQKTTDWITTCLETHDWEKSRIAYLGKSYDF